MFEPHSSETDGTVEETLSGYDGQSDSAQDEDLVDGSDADRLTLALFSSDEGGLSLEQRLALVCLMPNKFVSATGNPVEWHGIRELSRLIICGPVTASNSRPVMTTSPSTGKSCSMTSPRSGRRTPPIGRVTGDTWKTPSTT
ncbi:hypothetical protein [Catenulispora rubra]|uniref:hypothetical protein n=1 Tax=Catenulispora rubra TaxID=280293 RepID=UPI001892367E|nr:hypothetical protein [Catenulispora rubra]